MPYSNLKIFSDTIGLAAWELEISHYIAAEEYRKDALILLVRMREELEQAEAEYIKYIKSIR